MTHAWHWNKWRGDRKGHACELLVTKSGNGNIMVRFADGELVIAPRYAVRRMK